MNTSNHSVLTQGISKRAFILFMLAWVVFLAVQQGDNFDESEHTHAAWLMGCAGKRPYLDFFQNHNPLLWDILKIFYLVGGAGLSILYYGRALVVISALIFAYGLTTLAKRWSSHGGSFPGTMSGIATIALFSCLFPRLFVIRPESAGLIFFISALILWIRPRGDLGTVHRCINPLKDFLCGMFFGAALYASPRFALLCGAFVLFPAQGLKAFEFNLRRLISLVLGCTVFIIGYTAIMGHALSQLYFNIMFSIVVQKAGDGFYGLVNKLLMVAVMVSLTLIWFCVITRGEERKRLSLHIAYFLVLVVLAYILGAPLLYIQVFFAPIIWLTLLLTHAAARIDHHTHHSIHRAIGLVSVLCTILIFASIHHNITGKTTIVDFVNFKKQLLAFVDPSDKVLVRAALHPICVEDASFYGTPVVGYENRLCAAVHEMEKKWGSGLPECNYLNDITTQRPVLLDFVMVYILPRSDRPEFIKILNRDYYSYPQFRDIGILKNRQIPDIR